MCGIIGLWSKRAIAQTELGAVAQGACGAMRHRGPDAVGVWTDAESGLALGHQRLSILDLSPAGSQPMVSANGRFVCAYNGEVYNHHELRSQLEQSANVPERGWRGTSDTETLLHYIAVYGFKAAIEAADGMFALAVWDRKERKLYLARDRMGEKPLYYGWINGVFVFASELKSLRAMTENVSLFSGHSWRINQDALSLYLRHCYIAAPHCIYEGCYKLCAGHWVEIDRDALAHSRVQSVPYWSLKQVAQNGISHPFTGTFEEGTNSLDTLLRRTVANRMEADVPLGAFLSGGIDSSLIVALMQVNSSRPVKTFTIGFEEKAYNEAEHAKAVSKHLGTEHTELYVSPQQAMNVIPRLPQIYDEPFSDSSQIPTFLVAEMTKRHVTVSLSGDAGDELFGGYNRYFTTEAIWSKIAWCPLAMRRFARLGLRAVPYHVFDALFGAMKPMLPSALRISNPGDRIGKAVDLLGTHSKEQMFINLISQWRNESVQKRVSRLDMIDFARDKIEGKASFAQQMMFLDAMTYLPDDILVKVDRACMAVSLESRVPFLGKEVIDFAWQLPEAYKIGNGKGKLILRELLSRYVPRDLFERPKTGFGIPIDAWLRSSLRDWAENLLEPSKMDAQGYLNTSLVQQKWQEHLSGKRRWHYELWTVLMFQAWLEEWM